MSVPKNSSTKTDLIPNRAPSSPGHLTQHLRREHTPSRIDINITDDTQPAERGIHILQLPRLLSKDRHGLVLPIETHILQLTPHYTLAPHHPVIV
jgi:hypothetical protein